MRQKYELLTGPGDQVKLFGNTVFRIRALTYIPRLGVFAGDLGGYVANETNLSHEGDAWVFGDACVSGNARVSGNACVSGNAHVSGNAWVHVNACVSGNARVLGNAQVSSPRHCLVIGPIGSENGDFTLFRTKSGLPYVTRGCFSGNLDAFEWAVNETHGDNQHGHEYRAVVALARLRAQEWEAA